MDEQVYSHYLKAFALVKGGGAISVNAFTHPIAGTEFNAEILAAIALGVQDGKLSGGRPREKVTVFQEIASLTHG